MCIKYIPVSYYTLFSTYILLRKYNIAFISHISHISKDEI